MKFVKNRKTALGKSFLNKHKKLGLTDDLYTRSKPIRDEEPNYLWQVEQLHSEDYLNGPYGSESILDNGNLIYAQKLMQRGEFLLGDAQIDTKERQALLSLIIQDTIEYLRDYMGLEIPKSISREIDEVYGCLHLSPEKFRSKFLSFLKKAQTVGGKPRRATPWVCAFLKVFSGSLTYQTSPRLQELDKESDDFADWFASKVDPRSISNYQELESAQIKRSNTMVQFNHGPFPIVNFYFRAKTKFSIISKLVRKPGDSTQTMIEDGIGARLIVRQEDVEKATKWLQQDLGMRFKKINNASRGEQKNKDIYLVGGTEKDVTFEVQISTAKNLKKGESGIYDSRIYKAKQELLIQSRLFGSVPKKQAAETIKELAEETGTPERQIKEEFERFFFAGPKSHQNKRLYSYEHVSRMFDNDFMPQKVKQDMCSRLDLMSARPPFELTLSDYEWYELFENFCFPNRFKKDAGTQKSIIEFLSGKEGISGMPKPLIGALKVLHETTKGNKPSKLLSYEQWQKLFEKGCFPEGINSDERVSIIEYLDGTKSFPFMCLQLWNKHSVTAATE